MKLRLVLSALLASIVWSKVLDSDEVQSTASFLRGPDDYLIRVPDDRFPGIDLGLKDAEKQNRLKTGCVLVNDLIETILDISSLTATKRYAADALSTCLLGDKENLVQMEHHKGFHPMIHQLLKTVPAAGAELIWVSVYSQPGHHRLLNELGVIDMLMEIAMADRSQPVEIMWALAAMSNMATSYCNSRDGQCSWNWQEEHGRELSSTYFDMILNGHGVRDYILEHKNFMTKLEDLACLGFAKAVEFPSKAKRGTNDLRLVPWAAASLLSNLATNLEYHHDLDSFAPCLCYMLRSIDLLEAHSAQTSLYHMGREASCHFANWSQQHHNDDANGAEEKWGELCVDHLFLSEEGQGCHDLFQADCEGGEADGEPLTPVVGHDGHPTAMEACCVCGGGDTYPDPFEDSASDEL